MNCRVSNLLTCAVVPKYVVTLLNQTHIFEWHLMTFVIKNGHRTDECYHETELCAQNTVTDFGLSSEHNYNGRIICQASHRPESDLF